MNQGVEILLARMDSNPDEFGDEYGNKWAWVVQGIEGRIMDKDKTVLPYLTDQEAQAIFDKLQDLKRDKFTKGVMATLLKEEEEHESDEGFMRYNTKGRGGAVSRAQLIADLLPSIEKEFGVWRDEANKKRGKK